MIRNLGQIDRYARLGIGVLLIVLTLMGSIGLWGWLGAILVATAAMNFCPIYRALGIKTCEDC